MLAAFLRGKILILQQRGIAVYGSSGCLHLMGHICHKVISQGFYPVQILYHPVKGIVEFFDLGDMKMFVRRHTNVEIPFCHFLRRRIQLLHRLKDTAHLMIQDQIRENGCHRDPQKEHDDGQTMGIRQLFPPLQVNGDDRRQDNDQNGGNTEMQEKENIQFTFLTLHTVSS